MKVYVLTLVSIDYSKDEEVYGVFSSSEKAKEHARTIKPSCPMWYDANGDEYWDINDWIIDNL